MQRVKVLVLAVLVIVASGAAREILVTSTADAGTGTLRWALQTARPGDVVLFNPSVFPPGSPAVIHLMTGLPCIWQGRVTVDASYAGVILDGSRARGEWVTGIDICSNDNTIMGLQIVNFSGAGIHVSNAHRNTIGGDRTKGTGPLGQGNLTSGNADGIGLRGACDNVIVGNLIGTDVTQSKPMGNRVVGIFIQDGASRNVIGPSNVIAFNHHNGVDVRDLASVQNTLTANSIHSNASLALEQPRLAGISEPTISFFDLETGNVSGMACAGCLVEVFSDSGHQGATYEGEARADDSGRFSFSAGRPLVGPKLTATATDPLGNTSVYSAPTWGAGGIPMLQVANEAAREPFALGSAASLPDNRIGAHWYVNLWSPESRPHQWATIAQDLDSLGIKWVRLSLDHFDAASVERYGGDYSHRVVPSYVDAGVTELAQRGIEIVYCLTYWDPEGARPAGQQVPGYARFETEREIQRYLEYVRFLVSHFRGQIKFYEIWNEPNIARGTQQHIRLETYTLVASRAADVIREVDPEARVVFGAVGIAEGTMNCQGEPGTQQYLLGLAGSTGVALCDVVSWHPMYGTSPDPRQCHHQYYHDYPALVRTLKKMAWSKGFEGEFMAEEINWRTPRTYFEHEPMTYSEVQSAKYYGRGILIHLGLDVHAGLIIHQLYAAAPEMSLIRNLCTVMAGHEAINMPVEIHIDYDGPMVYCSFRYPNGDRILALWTDSVAQEEDPGVPAVVRFPGISAGRVTGIDVLHGFEQELIFDSQGGSTEVRDILVRDYPMLIRLSGLTFGPDYVETVGDGFHQMGDMAVASGRGEERHAIGEPIVLSLEASAAITLLWLRDDGSKSTVRFHSTRYVAESGRHEASIPTTGLMPGLYELWIKDKVRLIRLVNR